MRKSCLVVGMDPEHRAGRVAAPAVGILERDLCFAYSVMSVNGVNQAWAADLPGAAEAPERRGLVVGRDG